LVVCVPKNFLVVLDWNNKKHGGGRVKSLLLGGRTTGNITHLAIETLQTLPATPMIPTLLFHDMRKCSVKRFTRSNVRLLLLLLVPTKRPAAFFQREIRCHGE
jgi:hypothetical protein